MPTKPSSNIAILTLTLAMLIWASSFIALKITFQELHPAQVLFGRMLLASVFFVFMLRWMGRLNYQRGDWKLLLMMAIMEPCLYFIFESLALQNTTASQAGVVTSLLPLLTAIGAYLVLDERLHIRTWLGFAIAIVGAIILSVAGDSSETAPNPMLGNFYELLAMVCAAVYTLAVKHLVSRYSPLFLTALQSWVGAIFFLGPAMYVPLPETISTTSVVAVMYLGIIVSIGAYGLYNYSLTRVPATQASAFINLIPVFTVIIAFLVLGEYFNHTQFIACSVIIIGLYLSRTPKKQDLN
ncbi:MULTISPECIES: DMT family transporter [unclassified Oleiphilus]|uniref:DMT family transporter n=2 Tax=Oleiphilus TaxID=141450 RepID=UPI0007C3D52B|nr:MULTISPECIES: DMT family transporter [unclassified Oleiphilus]KZY65109.1 hypothetical protein A3738_18615 [Oleiphilus sp. HI0066]KZY66721.1 hypothetical protein A3738_06015 [Oleiphilus sp. HI0066]KZY73083.1 hypothetical protein A3739_02845 [Oleiphilus sp. HI0067]MCH2157258.1 DMT family transporter [Oleiphilaceae bacterium]